MTRWAWVLCSALALCPAVAIAQDGDQDGDQAQEAPGTAAADGAASGDPAAPAPPSTLQQLRDGFANPVTPIDRANATGAPQPEPVAAPVEQETGRDDPFSLDGISQTRPEVAPETAFRPSDARPDKLPEMTLRGIGRMNGDDVPTALIDIKGHGLFIVTENDTVSLQSLSESNNVLRIVEITDISVTVEAGSFGELIVVR